MNAKLNLSAAVPGSCCSLNGLTFTCCDSEHEKQHGGVVLMARDENAAFGGICVSFTAKSFVHKL